MPDTLAIIDAAYKTDPGSRPHNEDAVKVYTNARDVSVGGRLFIVADGVGGEANGSYASSFAVDRIGELYYDFARQGGQGQSYELLTSAIEQTNADLYKMNADRHAGPGQRMVTTVVCALFHQNEVAIAWVGDSRAYLLQQYQKLRLVTTDHTRAQFKFKAGQITESMVEVDPDNNILARSIGAQYSVEVEVLTSEAITEGDIVILCSDGITKHLTGAEIETIVKASPVSSLAVEKIVSLSNRRGGIDNISVVVVYVGERAKQEGTIVESDDLNLYKLDNTINLATLHNSNLERKDRNFVSKLKENRLVLGMSVIGLTMLAVIIILLWLLFAGSEDSQSAASLPTLTSSPTDENASVTATDIVVITATATPTNTASIDTSLNATIIAIGTEVAQTAQTAQAAQAVNQTPADGENPLPASSTNTPTSTPITPSPTNTVQSQEDTDSSNQIQEGTVYFVQQETYVLDNIYLDPDEYEKQIEGGTQVIVISHPTDGTMISLGNTTYIHVRVTLSWNSDLAGTSGWVDLADLQLAEEP